DPELAQTQTVVRLELDHRTREHRQALATRMFQQVSAQLAGECLLVVREALTIGRREVHPVLVRHVGARHRKRLVLLHLARQLAGDLDGTDLGPEGTTERAFDEAGDLALQSSKHAHRGTRVDLRRGRRPCYGTRPGAARASRRWM